MTFLSYVRASPSCNCKKSMVIGWDCNYFANEVFKEFTVYFFFPSRLNEDEVLYINVKGQMQVYYLV